MPREQGVRVVARNRRATHDYTIGDTWAVSYTHLTLPTILLV